MGLDMHPLSRPKPGMEAEFEALWRRINVAEGLLRDDNPKPANGFLARLMRALTGPKQEDTGPLIDRLHAISDPHWALLDAPVVGRDRGADDWVRASWEAGRLAGDFPDADAAVEGMAGLHVLELLPDCDGFPIWSNGSLTGVGDRASLRGQVLAACGAVLPEHLIARAWEPMLARDLGAWGRALQVELAGFCDRSGIRPDPEAEDLDTPQGQVAAVDAAARWALWWSSKGHGSSPDF